MVYGPWDAQDPKLQRTGQFGTHQAVAVAVAKVDRTILLHSRRGTVPWLRNLIVAIFVRARCRRLQVVVWFYGYDKVIAVAAASTSHGL